MIERLRDFGDQVAWREFDELYRELILRYSRRRGLQPADAEDIRQLAVMGLARSLEQFEYRPELGRFRDYLGTIVKNLVRHHFARKDRRKEQPMPSALDLIAPAEPDDVWDKEWMLHHYRNAMGRVRESASTRSIEIFDGLLGGESVESLVKRFETSRDAVYKIKQRVRERLQHFIELQVEEEVLPRDPLAPVDSGSGTAQKS